MAYVATTPWTVPADEVAARRRGVVDLPWRACVAPTPWTWLRQVHGDRVVRVEEPGAHAGARADAAVTAQPGCAMAVLTADCAPVVLASTEGVIGVAHAGWAGVLAGVVQRTVEEMRGLGAQNVTAIIGPCIRAECYEFGADHLARLTDRFGPQVAGRTAGGAPALDLPAAVRSALAEAGVHDMEDIGLCTACSGEYYSWRARRERQRQATVLWM
jgi:YfiH family protein